MNKAIATSPQVYARTGGALYLAIIVFGAFAEGFVMNKLVAPGDAATTAHNIMAAPGLWGLAVAADLIIPVIAVAGVWISYVLLSPVSRSLILLDVFFTLVSLAVEAVSKLFLLLVVPILSTTGYLKAFDPRQLRDPREHGSLRSHDMVFNIALIFFSCALPHRMGYLIYQIGLLPQIHRHIDAACRLVLSGRLFRGAFCPCVCRSADPGYSATAIDRRIVLLSVAADQRCQPRQVE